MMNKLEQGERFITRSALAARWGVSYMTIRRREKSGHLTPQKVFGATIRYRWAEVKKVESMGIRVFDEPVRFAFHPYVRHPEPDCYCPR